MSAQRQWRLGTGQGACFTQTLGLCLAPIRGQGLSASNAEMRPDSTNSWGRHMGQNFPERPAKKEALLLGWGSSPRTNSGEGTTIPQNTLKGSVPGEAWPSPTFFWTGEYPVGKQGQGASSTPKAIPEIQQRSSCSRHWGVLFPSLLTRNYLLKRCSPEGLAVPVAPGHLLDRLLLHQHHRGRPGRQPKAGPPAAHSSQAQIAAVPGPFLW